MDASFTVGAHCTAESLIVFPKSSRAELYRTLIPQIRAFIAPEPDLIANLANVAAVLNTALKPHWVGFYFKKGEDLVLGPYQGPLACTRINIPMGVCGACAQAGEPIVVPDVNKFPGHIACSSQSQSEIVVPLLSNDGVELVLDIDSASLAEFSAVDQRGLQGVINVIRERHFESAPCRSAAVGYLERAGLARIGTAQAGREWAVLEPGMIADAARRFHEVILNAVTNASRLADLADDVLFTYRVPKLSTGGACSLPGTLDPVPYDLGQTLPGGRSQENTRFLTALKEILDFAGKQVTPDWIGVYRRHEAEGEAPRLVKLVYNGRPSRAEFPLTAEFAAGSNNSTVGLCGKGVIVDSVKSHVEKGGPFYVCDGEVNSEVCLPIFSRDGARIIGIVDAESFPERFFNSQKVAQLCALCIALSDYLE